MMRRMIGHVCLSMVLLGLVAAMPACQTDQPGVRSTHRSQYGNVEATTQQATQIAREVLEELELRDIRSNATAVDGQVIGKTADDTQVTVTVERVTDTTSEVSVRVGTFGSPELGQDILARIHQRASQN